MQLFAVAHQVKAPSVKGTRNDSTFGFREFEWPTGMRANGAEGEELALNHGEHEPATPLPPHMEAGTELLRLSDFGPFNSQGAHT
jgi:hypothetical protein